jgi:hypothetical protein
VKLAARSKSRSKAANIEGFGETSSDESSVGPSAPESKRRKKEKGKMADRGEGYDTIFGDLEKSKCKFD